DVLKKLNDASTPQTTRDGWFDSLPTDEAQSTLEYSTSITNRTTGATRKVYNFALAKVRLQGANGASNVRTFFRLFRYSATNLTFGVNSLVYRFFDAGGNPNVKGPLLGFSSDGDVISVPFFASTRVPASQAMTIQRDTPNVGQFAAGIMGEQV